MTLSDGHHTDVQELTIRTDDHALGPVGAPVTLIEYGDYTCSWSGQAHQFVGRARARYDARMRYIYRHFPMRMMRHQSQQAAEAAEAAGAQGRFWEMHDLLFTHQAELDAGHLVEYASTIGLDTTRFLRDMAGHAFADRVQIDVASGVSLGVNTTPTFVINGQRFDHAWDEGPVREAIERAARPDG